jgi:hypothetical protein
LIMNASMTEAVATTQKLMLEPLKTHAIDSQHWKQQLKVTLNIALDGCIVPTQSGAARVDYSHLVVLENFLDEPTRQQLLDYITEPGWTSTNSSSSTQHAHPPNSKWEQATCDAADVASKPRARTWGLTAAVLRRFAADDVPAKLEVQSRLCALYPDAIIAHMPSEHIQAGLVQQQHQQLQQQQHRGKQELQQQTVPQQQQQQLQQQQHREKQELQQQTVPQQQQQHPSQQQELKQQQQQQREQLSQPQQQQHASQQDGDSVAADCSCFLANAAVHGDSYSWHVDADPSTFPCPSPWTDSYGSYCNREPGKPLLFSLLLYLDGDWPLDHDAETLFLDAMSATGVFVRPKRWRAVLMDQDVVHR